MQQRATVYALPHENVGHEGDAAMATSMPLAMAGTGQKVWVHSLAGGRGMEQRLASMGLNVGSEVEVISKGHSGPVIVATGNTRMAIGSGMAHKIIVSTAHWF